jgi:hypothetical protein
MTNGKDFLSDMPEWNKNIKSFILTTLRINRLNWKVYPAERAFKLKT